MPSTGQVRGSHVFELAPLPAQHSLPMLCNKCCCIAQWALTPHLPRMPSGKAVSVVALGKASTVHRLSRGVLRPQQWGSIHLHSICLALVPDHRRLRSAWDSAVSHGS